MRIGRNVAFAPLSWGLLLLAGCASAPGLLPFVVPEQRNLDLRAPHAIPHSQLPELPPPVTVAAPAEPGPVKELSLDEAIRISLANAKVIRTLAGAEAVSSGRTIYDPAVANTNIDAAKSVFDPVITATNAFSRNNNPQGVFDAGSPAGSRITSSPIDNYELGLGISKKATGGGTLSLNESLTSSRFPGSVFPLNPQSQSNLALSYTQPLLQGAGAQVNLAPIMVARIRTEVSFFQLKDSVQDLVRGTIEAYWSVVFARTDAWARRQQVEQGEAAYARANARKEAGFGSTAEVAQADVALSNFRATLITAESNLLTREAALRNLLGIPPTELIRFVPVTPPTPVRVDPKWDEIVKLAQEMRPDLIELNLILEADQQNLIVARNQSLPQLDATMRYQWNGLDGIAPSGERLATSPGQYANWALGVNFSVPLGLRKGRAALRNAELVLITDKANLQQAGHAAIYQLQGSLRNLAQNYELYLAFSKTRRAARVNLEQQIADFRAGRAIFLNVLQAITDWGNAVSSEAQSLAQYNIELANLEKQTGTILESHSVRFMEERFGSLGPLGRLAQPRAYPLSAPPSPNADRYPETGGPPDKALDKDRPMLNEPGAMPAPKEAPKELPAPKQLPDPKDLPAPKLPPPLQQVAFPRVPTLTRPARTPPPAATRMPDQ